jgi:hypothetical protein
MLQGTRRCPMQKKYVVRLMNQERDELRIVVKKFHLGDRLAVPSMGVTRILAGFKSRWTMPF